MECTSLGYYSRPMTTLGSRLRAAREAAGLTQVRLASLVGVRSQSVNQWESGYKAPSRDNLLMLARITSAPLDWLLYGGPLPERDANGRLIPRVDRGSTVPMYKLADAVRGRGSAVAVGRVHAYFPCSDNAVCFEVPDDSNVPEYPSGTIWIVDPDVPPAAGCMVVATHGDRQSPIIGRLRYETTSSGRVTIVAPINPDWAQARSDIEPVQIIAVMTESIRRGR